MIRASDSTYHTWLERGQHQVSSGDDKDTYKHTQIQIQGQRQRQTHTQMMGESPRPDEIRMMEIGGEFISNLNPHPPTSTHKHTQTQTHKHTHTRPCTYTHTNPDSTVNGIKRMVYFCRTHRVPTLQLLFSSSHNPRNLRA